MSASADPQRDKGAFRWVIGVATVAMATAITVGDCRAPSDRPEFVLDDFPVTTPSFEPVTIDALEFYDPFATVALEHEVHVSVLDGGQLVATGLVRNPDGAALSGVSMQVHCRDAGGVLLATRPATLACRRLQPNEVCAWSLDAQVAGASEFVFEGRAARGQLIGLPTLDLRGRFDHEGAPISSLVSSGGDELEFDPAAGTLRLRVDADVTVLDNWVTVTSFDARRQVLGVEQTDAGELLHGAERVTLAVAVAHREDAQLYEVRVGGDLVMTPPRVDPSLPR